MRPWRALAAGALAALPVVAGAQTAPGTSAAAAAVWVAPGVSIMLSLPAGGEAVPDGDLPKLDLAGVEDAKVVLRRGVRRATATPEHVSDVVTALCVSAPGARLPAEATPAVLEKIGEMARTELARTSTIDRFEDGPIAETLGRWEQSFVAEARLAGAGAAVPVHAEGRRLVGFVGAGPDAIVCAVVCTEVSTAGARVCPAVAASLRFEGAFVAPPRASLPGRILFAAVRRPLAAAGALLGLVLLVGGLLLALVPLRRGRISSA